MRPGKMFLATFLLSLVGLSLLGIGVALWWQQLLTPTYLLPMFLIVGIVVLIGALGAEAAVLKLMELSDPRQALGLPAGSVRAVIALSLILVFSIMAVFLYTQESQPATEQSRGLTADLVQTLPQAQILAIVAEPNTSPALYDVTVKQNSATSPIAQQLITVLGTLVTAVAAFYFGQTSARTGTDAESRGNPGQPEAKPAVV